MPITKTTWPTGRSGNPRGRPRSGDVQATLAPVIVEKNEQEKRLVLMGGGVIELWSLDSPGSGRGRKYALVVVDEAAMIANLEEAWQQSIRPTLTDLRGDAWFLSAPKGMNYFKTLFNLGQDPQREDWAAWQMPQKPETTTAGGHVRDKRRYSRARSTSACLRFFGFEPPQIGHAGVSNAPR